MLRFLLLLVLTSTLGLCLNNFVDDFQTLNYNPRVVSGRQKRSTNGGGPIDLKFIAYNRTFEVVLFPLDDSTTPFHLDHVMDIDGDFIVEPPHKHLFDGYLKGDPHSRVYGSILDGVFDGHLHTSNGDTFSIDRASKYFDVEDRPTHYHSIIYHDNEINHSKMRVKRDVNVEPTHGCGLDEPLRKQMQRVQRSADPQMETYTNYMTMAGRSKRSTRDQKGLYSVRTCSLYMQADHKLYEHIKRKEGNNDPIRTREEIVSLFYNHIKAVNEIYEGTNFDGIKGLHFVIQRTSIFTPDTCENGKAKPGSDNPFCDDNVDVSNFLNLNSQRNHSAFCLAYALTFRDFVGGTLGLAWVASPQYNTAGGICQVYQRYNEGSRGWVHRSLNTGIVTLVNYGNRVPTRVSQLTLAHEIGHNFGSPHDFPLECQPGLPDGNFIMFASATSGDKPNNAKFSRCSISNISAVLNVVLQQVPVDPTRNAAQTGIHKRNCFQERTSAFCGNQIWEPGEECDCGFSQADCDQMGDKCCVPHESGRMMDGPGPCRRKVGARCSPSEGYCCNPDSCSLFEAREWKQCRQACNNGSCTGSVCELVGLKDCFLTEGKPEELCFLACLKDGKCTSSVLLPEFASNRTTFIQSGRKGKSGLVLHPGSPCNNYKGYCDIFRKCRSVDANGPLARLKNLLFDKRTIESVTQWVQENWWAVIVGGVGLLIVMAIFVKCCAVHTPSTNPNKPPALNIYQTLTRPGTLIRQRRHRHRSAAGAQTSNQNAANQGSRPSTAPVVGGRSSSRPSAPPMPSAPIPLIPSGSAAQPTAVIVVEPPPPYTVNADPGTALGGPPRGHRKKRQTAADAVPKTRPKGK